MDAGHRSCPETDVIGMVGDVHRAVAWIKANAARYGIDPARVVVMGGSSGAHIALLAAYAPEHPRLIPDELKGVDTSVMAVVSYYGIPEMLASDLALVARLHDIGKADPRFQQMLHGGSAVRMAASPRLLAKSRGDAGDRAARERARDRARYPRGYRHELLSVALLEANAATLELANDRDLVLHLIGSHHGWCRPFAPAVDDGLPLIVTVSLNGQRYNADAAHGLASVDSGIADRYWLLTERYGWWTLAWFEALVRLADHRASEEARVSTEADVHAPIGATQALKVE